MRSGVCVGVGIAALLTILCSVTIQPAYGQSFNITAGGFSTGNVCQNSNSPAPGCQVLTNGIPNQPQVTSGGALRLTTANNLQHGSAWFYVQQPLANGFTTSFQFQISNTNMCRGCSFPADGLAFVIQNDPAGTGALGYAGDGGDIGYGNDDVPSASGPGQAILNSLAIELDTYQNANYGDPDSNHIAVQSCGPNTPSALAANSADHDYICPNGLSANLALQSLPAGLLLSDGNVHTITVNYLPPGTCSTGCNNLTVYFDSTQILQATVNLATQLNLTSGTSAYIGFTAATGALVQNNDIISWSYSQWPISPIIVTQPVQPTTPTNFNYTSTLSAVTDYSQSGLPSSSFAGLFMQGEAQTITDQQFSDLVNNTPFQGSTCQHQFIGTDANGNNQYACVTTTDLCTNAASSTPAGANCLGTNGPLINVSNTYNLDPAQKAVLAAPGYIMGKDTAISCGASADNTCKGLISIFAGMNGDSATTTGHTNNFNSVLIPIFGSAQPSTSVTTNPPLNSGWTNASNLTVNFNSTEIVPGINTNPPGNPPTPASIFYSASGANVPSPASNTIPSATGSVSIPITTQGTTVITYAATDTSNIVETVFSNNGTTVSTASPTFTFNVDLTPPALTCSNPAPSIGWQITNVSFQCTASDSGGSGLVGPSTYNEATTVPAGTETNNATIPALTVGDVAGNQTTLGPFGPYEVDMKPPMINALAISPASPVYGQQVTASFSCTDGGSGVVQCGPSGSPSFPATANTGTITTNVNSATGGHTFTVNAQDAVGNVSAPVSVSYTVGQATPTVSWSTPAAITYGTALNAAQLDASANVPGTYAYTPAAGTTPGAGIQTLSVIFTPTDTTDYKTATASVQLMVNKGTPTVTWAPPSAITYGTALSAAQLNATASVLGTFAYLPAAGAVLHAGTQSLSVTFTPTDGNDYNPVTTTVMLTVKQASPVITWPAPAPISYGTSLSAAQLDATANVAGSYMYSPAAGTVLHAGVQTLSVSFTPADSTDYSSANASVLLTVNQIAPVLTWATPATISYGTPLSATQLDATANVAGTFAYSPAAGTILPTGTQTLAVLFTPSDTVDYTKASASVSIAITGAQVLLSPSSINFGNVPLAAVVFRIETITNNGNATLNFKNIAIVPGAGTDNVEYVWVTDCLPWLPPGGNCQVVVFFLADKLGSHPASLVISDNAAGSPQTVPLSANVVKP